MEYKYRKVLGRKHFLVVEIKFEDSFLNTVMVIIKTPGWNNYNHIGQALNTVEKKYDSYECELVIDNLFWKNNRHSVLPYNFLDENDYIMNFVGEYLEDRYFDYHNYKIKTPKENIKEIDNDEWKSEYTNILKEVTNKFIKRIVIE